MELDFAIAIAGATAIGLGIETYFLWKFRILGNRKVRKDARRAILKIRLIDSLKILIMGSISFEKHEIEILEVSIKLKKIQK